LIHEKSPYLLEHAYNPVDWYPWGEEAFRKSKQENKPIFLSIGYSSCHWCHVLRKESFEDYETAKFLNENFVNIKVDREERPDIDEVYMRAVMTMTGSGGWPLSVFLTPNLEPFFGGTYFPPAPRYGMPSFLNVAKNIADSWKKERKNLVESASDLREALTKMYESHTARGGTLSAGIVDDAYTSLVSSFDSSNGGFGESPKFPMPSNLFFLMRYYRLMQSKLALSMVTKTLDAMMSGGIYDQVGGGFHRYSTDRYWLVPHFEKMLYDNAMLATAFTEAFLITRNSEYARVVRETLGWAIREMYSGQGFSASQDADSPEGEGLFYVWSVSDLQKALESRIPNWTVLQKYFSITAQGNFDNGKTILTTKPVDLLAKEFDMTKDEFENLVEEAKKMMLDYRNTRARPSTDDKIVTSWNGLMITALSKASSALGDKQYLFYAISTADLILERVDSNRDHVLSRSYRSGEESGIGVLEDYAFFINGLIDLYEACFDPRYLNVAISLCRQMITKFHDPNGGFFLADITRKDLIAKPKDSYDGAIPSGNSIAALVLLRLAELTMKEDFRSIAKQSFEAFWEDLSNQPSSFTAMVSAFQFFMGPTREIVLSGDIQSLEKEELISALRSQFMPNTVTILADERLVNASPLLNDKLPKSNGPRVFVCSNFTCKMPVSSKEELLKILSERANPGQ
jgi:uncharacterized protein YyaL (SSP411 family)